MNMIDSRLQKQAADPALSAVCDRLREKLLAVRDLYEGHLNSARELEPTIEDLQRALKVLEGELGAPPSTALPVHEISHDLDIVAVAPVGSGRGGGRGRKTGPEAMTGPIATLMRETALRLAKERVDGFLPQEVMVSIQADESTRDRVEGVHENYIYKVLKRLRSENLLDKNGHRYVAPSHNAGSPLFAAGVSMNDAFKMVPKTKEDRVREEATRYLLNRKNYSAHRAQIADHLTVLGVMGTEKQTISSLSVYLARWSEFVADGHGNYTLIPAKKTNGGQ